MRETVCSPRAYLAQACSASCYTKEKEERKPRQFFRYHVLPPKKNGRKQMLSSPASGNYLFHGGTVTSVYLGQTNRERIVTSPPFCLCLCRHFRLAGCHIQGPRAALCLLTEHTLRMQPDDQVLGHLADPPPHKPTAAPTKIQHPVSRSRRRVCCWAPARHGRAALIVHFN